MAFTATKSDIGHWSNFYEVQQTTANQVICSADLSAWGDGTHHAGGHFLVIIAMAHQSPIVAAQSIWSVKVARGVGAWLTPVATKLAGTGSTVDFVMSSNTLQVRVDGNAGAAGPILFTTIRGPVGESLP